MLVLGEVSLPEDGVRLIQDQVVAYLNDQPVAGEGTLAVAEGIVTWISRTDGRGFSLSYPSIIMHAISTDCSSFPHEHVLVIVDAGRSGTTGRGRRPIPLYTEEEAATVNQVQLAQQELRTGEGDGEGEEEEASEDGNLILRFVPADLSALDKIYNEMAACQELNPEEDDDMSEDEDEDEGEGADMGAAFMTGAGGELGPGWFTAANLHDAELSEEGRANLERMIRGAQNGHDGDEHDANGEHDMEE